MPVPLANPLTAEKIRLGEILFFDKSLSRDGTIACASCHQPERAFTDGRPVSIGIEGQKGRRNAPSLFNIAYGKSLFWDGRLETLEQQALVPIVSPEEMGNTVAAALTAITSNPHYSNLFLAAFGSPEISALRLVQALASYQRSLLAADSPFDRYDRWNDQSALSEVARRGLALFRGKARCAHCHEGPIFSDQRFHNTGVGWSRDPPDLGRFEHTRLEEDRGRFRTPTLRNLIATAPYMHNGTLATLNEVIDFYDRGANPNPFLDEVIRPLGLSQGEKADLLAFLKSLSVTAGSGMSPTNGQRGHSTGSTQFFRAILK